MMFTDVFLKRPVIPVSVSILLLLAGVWALLNLPLGLYPAVAMPVVEINTPYPGASPEAVQNYVTVPLQSSLADLSGVDYIRSASSQGSSSISLHFRLGQNPDRAVSNVMRRLQGVSGNLPAGVLSPTVQTGQGDIHYFILQANTLRYSPAWLTDWLERMVVPQIELQEGISSVGVWGPVWTMEIRLDPALMLARNISAGEVAAVLQKNSLPATVGKTQGESVSYALNPGGTLHTVRDFSELLVKNTGNNPVSLKDVGSVQFHGLDETTRAWFDGKPGAGIGIALSDSSNPLTVSRQLSRLLPVLSAHFPQGIHLSMAFDLSTFVRASLHEVMYAIAGSVLVVIAVMLVLMGNVRTVAVPLSAIPLSLAGACFIMVLCGFSLNTLTLLAMVLAIGLVVDDAIVVAENIVRHMEAKKPALTAALLGAREMAAPVIAMTLTLAAVYAPMMLAGGITGRLFTEFAVTLAGSVLVSGVIALVLSPLLCARLISLASLQGQRSVRAAARVAVLCEKYVFLLGHVLSHPRKVGVFWLCLVAACGVLYQKTPHELVPEEDMGILQVTGQAPAAANLNWLEKYRGALEAALKKQPEVAGYFEVLRENGLFGYLRLKDWSQRKRGGKEIAAALQTSFADIAGLSLYAGNISLLPGTHGNSTPSLLLAGNVSYPVLYEAAGKVEQAATASGHFLYVQDDLQYNQPQVNVTLIPSAAAAMNVSEGSMASELSALLGKRSIQQFSWQGHLYDAEITVPESYRRNPEDILKLSIPNRLGQLVPLSGLVRMKMSVVPQQLNQFQRMNSVKITAMLAPGVGFSAGLRELQAIVDNQVDNKNIFVDYAGISRQFLQEGQRTLWVFGMAVLVIFLVLGIQFNRFQDALVILLGSVPLALWGAMLPLWLGLGTINLYTRIGLLTLVGLVSKHGILLTEFANRAQLQQNLSPREAVQQAARLRFRPILMTTVAMMAGALPLVFARGAGAASRHAIGIVMVSGMGIGTLFTLFVVPVLYLWFGRDQTKKEGSPLG